jgi:septal ring factor EnvC (AmiA/AmiB activator)
MKRDKPQKEEVPQTLTMRLTSWVGSVPSLILHTLIFAGFFGMVWFGVLALETMLLILTTIVSLEAIYLAIFIQMSVNANTLSLREVEEDIEEIQEDVEEIGEDIDEIQEDVEEMSEELEEMGEDIEEMNEEELRDKVLEQHMETRIEQKADALVLEQLMKDVSRVLEDLEALKRGK